MRRWVCKLSTNPPRLPTGRNTNCTFIIILQILKSHSWLLSWMDFHISGWISLPGKTNICHFSLKYGYSVRADRISPGSGLPSQCKLKYCNRTNQTFMGSVKFTRLLESTEVPLTEWFKSISLLLTNHLTSSLNKSRISKNHFFGYFQGDKDCFFICLGIHCILLDLQFEQNPWMTGNRANSPIPFPVYCLFRKEKLEFPFLPLGGSVRSLLRGASKLYLKCQQ